jgi:hypothetical protein
VQAEEDKTAEARREVECPAFLRAESEQIIRDWLEHRSVTRDWWTVRDFKEQIVAELERTGMDETPSKSYYTRCIERLLEENFVSRLAQPSEENHYNVRMGDIERYFSNLGEMEISKISYHITINLDETGFGASKSGTQKSRRVIMPQLFLMTPIFKESTDSYLSQPYAASRHLAVF